jgi:hypothetical protein
MNAEQFRKLIFGMSPWTKGCQRIFLQSEFQQLKRKKSTASTPEIYDFMDVVTSPSPPFIAGALGLSIFIDSLRLASGSFVCFLLSYSK